MRTGEVDPSTVGFMGVEEGGEVVPLVGGEVGFGG